MFGNNPQSTAFKDWTLVFETNQEFEADMMKNFLSDRDIDAKILSKKDSAYSVNHSQLSLIYVYVPNESTAKAKEAIREFEDGELLDDQPNGD